MASSLATISGPGSGVTSMIRHPLPVQQGPGPQHLQHSRSSNVAHQQPHPDSPHQNQHANSFPSPHPSNQGLPLHHQSTYTQPVPGANGHPPPEVFYAPPSPYGTPIPGQFSAAEAPDIMAAAHMQQRPYQQPVYHTPQSNSPASVASSQSHDQHGRMYAQAPAQMQQVYGYPQYQVQPSAYPQHPGQQQQQQHHMMASQPLLPHQQAQATMAHQSSAQQPGITNSPRPQAKLEPGVPRQIDPTSLQRSPTGQMASNLNLPPNSSQNGNGLHAGQSGGGGVNPNAAPGPIPATTPLVVRQDNNGVQWIAFEYSRDRVKMEYTIRCDVESVNTDSLPQDFRNENCVYPRACCAKDSYKGNRLQYENECNTVGWALAELNPCLRAKRGLIQRAVDSWRNSNQDPRLRSRRVRRMAKINTRKNANHTNNHLAGPRDVGGHPPSANPMAAPIQRPPPTNISMAGPAQLHHHHAHPDGSTTGNPDDVSVNGDFDPQPPRQQAPKPSPAAIRPSNVFHGYQAYPPHPASAAPSLPPHLSNGLDHSMPNHAISTSASGPTVTAKLERQSPSPGKKHGSVFSELPEAKRRKFILVDDAERKTRVRVKVNLESVEIAEIPDSYRRENSVYPRSWRPTEMPPSPRDQRARRIRFVEDEAEDGADGQQREGLGVAEMMGGGGMQAGRVTVAVPLPEKEEGRLDVPGLGRRAREREDKLNDLGYRMSWGQGRVFAGRVVFLQKSLDAYRNKVGSTMAAGGQDVSTVAPHLETRVGKKIWEGRKGRRARASKRADTP